MVAKIIGIERHRITTDGNGITTLVAFHGCPLRCKYCLNPQCLDEKLICRSITPQELLEEVRVDNLYFLATGGGVTFGGGEPLLQSKFIRDFCTVAPPEWNISIETSLNVNHRHIEGIRPIINHYFIDVKDLNHEVYKNYTSSDNLKVINNLRWLATQVPQERITIRLPIIPGYNDEEKRQVSIEQLKKMGYVNFDLFNYIISKDKNPQKDE